MWCDYPKCYILSFIVFGFSFFCWRSGTIGPQYWQEILLLLAANGM